jgi:DNA-binding SARP family transcriptional activator
MASSVAQHPPSSSPHRLYLLGSFELRCAGEPVQLPMSAQRALVFVALHGRPVRRSLVAGTLWMDTKEALAGASLRSALWRLRHPGHPLIEASPTHLRLAADLWVDYRDAVEQAQGLCAGACPRDQVADGPLLESLSCDLLPDWWDEWVLLERERYRQLRLHALEALCASLAAEGRFAHAVAAGLAAVACEPLRESAHRLLVQVHLQEGNRAEALHQYGICRQLLRDELGLQPSSSLERLVRPLLTDQVRSSRRLEAGLRA